MEEGLLYDGSSGDPTVVWYDPGGVTGWAVISVHPDALLSPEYLVLDNITHFACGEFYGNEFAQVDQMVELADAWPGAALGTEGFVMYDSSAGRKDDNLLSLVRLNAAFRYEMARHGRTRRVFRQFAALAKQQVTNERLKAWNYWGATAGSTHARDAVRHDFTFLKRIKLSAKLRAQAFPGLGAVEEA